MDWILSHEDELDNIPEPAVQPDTATTETTTTSAEEKQSTEPQTETSQQVAKSIKCDDCGKLFKNQTEVEFHVTKSGNN